METNGRKGFGEQRSKATLEQGHEGPKNSLGLTWRPVANVQSFILIRLMLGTLQHVR